MTDEVTPDEEEDVDPIPSGWGEFVTVTALRHGGQVQIDEPEGTVIRMPLSEAKELLASGAIKVESRRDAIIREALEKEGLQVQDEEAEPFEGLSLNDVNGERADNTLPGEPE